MTSVFFHTFGCKVNQYETEAARARLEKLGCVASRDFSSSDVCVINSCSVTEEADKKCRKFVRRILRENPQGRVLVTGCYATRDPEALRALSPRVEVYSNQEKDIIPQIVSGCSLSADESPVLTLFGGRSRAFVKVQDGCDAKCTYCIIPSLRPEMTSRSIDDITRQASGLLEAGFKEIVLTGIRLGSYGLASSGGRVGKVRGNLADLLKHLVKIPGDFRIRLSSLEITEVTEEILELARGTDKICRHFHLPIQSGNDSVLRRMGRWYDTAFFRGQIGMILKRLPDAGLTTDVIVGFPGETDENFEDTRQFLEKYFNGLHVFPFSARKGTPAVKLSGHCPPAVIRERVNILLNLDSVLRERFRAKFAGTSRKVLSEVDGGFTDNGIRIPLPLSSPSGSFGWVAI
ncbi:MAG: tRNA (N(6)-L-threonylcarbamoyladenosine(37)-C(2))-methylthiotransferase MtaB [Elusimicrobia bacterium RIFCSPLOWO2_01_FULL_54_10]|nr:MAG: tRNA (N(6)-L-threonylcarbamoyladenosine(37)-C(2))-methylthiotransferase MtaB [Elusimicrobia bacterium RIFCSPLOWO2_01_FULL_54_10]